jgi:8-oxo-dGTP pyrophosphatase MutT (NUDIX family)
MREARNPVLQAGGIVLRRQARGSRVLVVRSSDEVHWLFPKGRVEVSYYVL